MVSKDKKDGGELAQMVWFDSQNGWIQFVFANEQDTYYLPSLIKVGFSRYLLFCLKNAGYEAVYFWNQYEGKHELSYMDGESAEYYEKIRPKGILEKVFGEPANEDNSRNEKISIPLTSDTMEKVFYGIASGKKKAALVVPMKVFDEFFSENSRTEKLMERQKKQRGSKNLVLLTASARAEDSNRCLTGENRILSALFEEVRQAAVPDGIRHLYEKLQDNMDERCVYLNVLDSGIIRNIVKKTSILTGEEMIPAYDELIDKAASVIEWYYHSESFRRDVPLVLPENRKWEYQVINKCIQNQRNCDVILAWIGQNAEGMTAGEFRDLLKYRYPKENRTCYICSDSFLLRQWEQIVLPTDISKQYRQEWQSSMSHCRRLLKAVVLRGDEQKDRDNLDVCMDQMRKSLSDNDGTTFDYALKAMEYLLDTYYEQPVSRNDIWNFYRKIFELSEEMQKMERELDGYKDKIVAYRREMNELFQQMDEAASQNMNAEENGELDSFKQRLVQCDEEIEILNNLSKLKQNQRFNSRQVITSIEQAILGAVGGKQVDVQMILQQAMDMQQKILQHSIDTMKDINRISEKNPEILEKITGQPLAESQNLEERYKALIKKL